jgi:SAM-dependent methyltransferase
MRYQTARRLLPAALVRWVYHFESAIERELERFSSGVPQGALLLDAGAGEGAHRRLFPQARYVGADLGVGDSGWDYSGISVMCDLAALPLAAYSFDAAINVVTLEHLREPARALAEIARVLKCGAPLLVIAPHEWEVHQAPHDYYRYTRHGLEWLLAQAGFHDVEIRPVGGFFRLLARRLLNALAFFPAWAKPAAALFFVPPGLLLPLLDPLDKRRDFTLGYTCLARKSC